MTKRARRVCGNRVTHTTHMEPGAREGWGQIDTLEVERALDIELVRSSFFHVLIIEPNLQSCEFKKWYLVIVS